MYLTFIGYIYQFVFQKASATIKYCVSTVAGFALIAYLFPSWDVIALPTQALLAYVLMRLVKPKLLGFVVFVFVYSFHVAFILYVFYRTTYWGQPVCYIVAPLMFQTQKLTWLAYNIHDGWRQSKKQKLIPKQLRDLLPEMPPVHQFLAYLYNFHQVIYGPTIPFKDYKNFVESPALISDPELAPALRIEILKRFILGCAFLWISSFITNVLPIEVLYTSDFQLVTLTWKIMILWPIMFSYRCYFYYMWSFAETANLAVGLGYSGKEESGRLTWNIGRCFNFWILEVASSIRVIKNNWNICTHTWLRETVFERNENKFVAAVTVFSVVYLWHGVESGFLFFAYDLGLMMYASREVRLNLKQRMQDWSPKYGLKIYLTAAIITTQFCQMYLCIAYFCQYYEKFNPIYAQLYYYGHWIPFAAVVIGQSYRKRDKWFGLGKKEEKKD